MGGSKFTCGTCEEGTSGGGISKGEGTSGGGISEEEGTEEANAGAPLSAGTCSDNAIKATGTAFASSLLTARTTSSTASPSSLVSLTGIDWSAASLTGTGITSGADI